MRRAKKPTDEEVQHAQHRAIDILIAALENNPPFLERIALRFLKHRIEQRIFNDAQRR